MKKFFKLLTVNAGLLFLFLIGCQEIETLQVDLTEKENDIHYVDINQATMIASTIELPAKSSPKRKSEKAINNRFEVQLLGSKKIKESKSPLGKGNKALYHIINYEEGGFVIISADDRLSPIMAFSNDNPMPFTDEKEYPVGLTDWFINQKDLIEFIRDNPTAEISNQGNIPSNSKINFWDPCPIQRQIAPENLSYDPCDPEGGGGCEDQYTQVSALLSTQWDQVCGYNQFMPTLSCSPYCGRAYVGCVVVAMAQVMRYHAFPQGYNYTNMSNNSGNIHNATLMADIFNSFPSSEQIINCNGTGIRYDDSHYANAMTNSFGYSSATQGSYNSTIV